MIGLYGGIGLLIFISLFTIIVNPLLTILSIKESGLIDNLTVLRKIVLQTLVFLILAITILMIIRTFHFGSLGWLLQYTLLIGLIFVYYKIKNKFK